jgi:predicted RNA-binding protein with PUA-like domain
VLAISDEYALPLPLAILALAEEITKTSKVLKVPVLKTIKPKKPASKVDQLTKEMQKLSILYITLEEMQKAVNASVAAIINKMQL